jgi:Ran GTPase-activating protein (RanGAP) involved in mRNA processing and transport
MIGDEGVAMIAKVIESDRRLEMLDISDNAFGDEGASALVNALAKNPVILSLSIGESK